MQWKILSTDLLLINSAYLINQLRIETGRYTVKGVAICTHDTQVRTWKGWRKKNKNNCNEIKLKDNNKKQINM